MYYSVYLVVHSAAAVYSSDLLISGHEREMFIRSKIILLAY